MFLLRRVSQPAVALGCEDTIRFSNTIRTLVIFVLQQMISVKCATAMHTGSRCPFKDTTYTVAKRKPEKFGLAGIGTRTSDIPLQRSNQ